MTRKEEIETRKEEIKSEIATAETTEKVEELEKEIDALNEEVEAIEEHEKQEDVAKELEENSSGIKEIVMEEKKMEQRKFDLSSKEYRSAWAKKVMGLSEDKFTEDELRALGDAITTTATTFVASDSETQGINNGGLFIPTSVREELMELISQESPIFRDIRKLSVNGNVDLPYLFASDDANWYAETTETKNEGIEFKQLQLTGWELAKDVVITWKLEEMAVESFIDFIIDELYNKMGKALVNAVIYGDGNAKPTGITNGLIAIASGANQIENILNTYKSLSADAKIGAKVYISTDANLDIVSYKDENGNYPFLSGIPAVKGFEIEVDPYLANNDVVAGNMRNYILNENTPVRLDRESTVKGRKVTYGAYGIYDGKAKPGAFALGRRSISA